MTLEERIRELEAEGMTTSDAQAVAMAEGTEEHFFRPGSDGYGQDPEECFYCWGPREVHRDPDLEVHGLI